MRSASPSWVAWSANISALKKVSAISILLAEGVFDINSVIAGILLLTVFALVLDTAVSLFEDHLMRWRPVAGQTVGAHA